MTSQGLITGNKVEANVETKFKDRKCKFCGDMHTFGKKNCKAAGKQCDNCGKKDHLAKVCRSSKKTESSKVESAAESGQGLGSQVAAGAHRVADSNWACGALQGEEINDEFESYQSPDHGFYHENKSFDMYSSSFNSQKNIKEVIRAKQKIGVTRPGQLKRGKISKIKSKKVRQPTLVNNEILMNIAALTLVMLTGTAILSTLPSQQGNVSSAQAAEVSNGTLVLGHHVYHKGKGWLRQGARAKPMVELYSRLDMSAYKALGLKPPAKQVRVSGGQHLADTGASICLGGKSYLE